MPNRLLLSSCLAEPSRAVSQVLPQRPCLKLLWDENGPVGDAATEPLVCYWAEHGGKEVTPMRIKSASVRRRSDASARAPDVTHVWPDKTDTVNIPSWQPALDALISAGAADFASVKSVESGKGLQRTLSWDQSELASTRLSQKEGRSAAQEV